MINMVTQHIPTMVGFCPWWLWWESVRWQNPTICNDEETFLVQFRLVDWVTALRALIGFFSSAQCVLWSARCPFIFYDPVFDTIRRRGGYRGMFREEGEDTGAYLRGNHGSRVWKVQKTMWTNVFSAHLNKHGQIYVQWDTKTQILR